VAGARPDQHKRKFRVCFAVLGSLFGYSRGHFCEKAKRRIRPQSLKIVLCILWERVLAAAVEPNVIFSVGDLLERARLHPPLREQLPGLTS
jgi:hypothetical protein